MTQLGALDAEDRLAKSVRVGLVLTLIAAPLALGSVHEPAYVPLLILAYLCGGLSWARGHWLRAHGRQVPKLPARQLLVASAGLMLLQLVPLPPALLEALSPGSYAFHEHFSLVPVTHWHPISVSPPDTARGIAFFVAMSLLYGASFREFGSVRSRRRLGLAVVATGAGMTIIALWQAATGDTRIYGVFRPRWDWAVFGPYVNRNHFAGYMVMAVPLGIAFAGEAFAGLKRAWRRRGRRRYLAFGDPEGTALLRHGVAAMLLVVGLLATQSRAGVLGIAAAAGLLIVLRRRSVAAFVIGVLAAGVYWVDLSGLVRGFETRGIRSSRLELWEDALRVVPDFPWLGAGFNAYGTVSPLYQSYQKASWFGEAHNEYLQALTDTGLLGAALLLALLARLALTALRASRRGGPYETGLLAALAASAATNLVDFNWQIPANAATFMALAGLAMRAGTPETPLLDPPPDGA